MNEARLGVGFGASALGYAGYQYAAEYAHTRQQGRRLGEGPTAEQVAIVEHPDVKRMLLAQKAYAEGGLALCLYCAHLLDRRRTEPESAADLGLLLDLLTPIAKSWPSQWCLEGNSLAIQVHGGYGYTREYNVEQLYRDNRLNPIHEGTHGIQAQDLLGRKVIADSGRPLVLLGEQISTTVARGKEAGPQTTVHAEALDEAWQALQSTTAAVWASGDPALVLSNATGYLEAFGHVVVAWIWLDQQLAATGDSLVERGKHAAARYFFTFELNRIYPTLELLRNLDTTLLDTPTDIF